MLEGYHPERTRAQGKKIFLKATTEEKFPELEGHDLQTKWLPAVQLNCSQNKIYHNTISKQVTKKI